MLPSSSPRQPSTSLSPRTMDSDTSLSLPTTTAPTDFTDLPCPSTAANALRGLVFSPHNSGSFPRPPETLPWDNGIDSDHQREHKQQEQQQYRGAKRLCDGLFKNFHGCRPRNSTTAATANTTTTSGTGCSSTSTSDMGRYVSSTADHGEQDGSVIGSGSSSGSDLFRGFWSRSKKQPVASSQRSVQESSQRALDHFPSPAVLFPQPALEFDFRIAVKLRPEPSRISPRPAGAAAAGGAQSIPPANGTNSGAHSGASQQQQQQQQREITAVQSGSWSGSFGHGKVLAGGYDLGQARGFRPIRIVEGVFVMQTTDDTPAILEMRTRGSLSGPCDVLDALLSPVQSHKTIDPRCYGFRMFSTIKTTDKRYAEIVNCGLWVASGVWRNDELIIDAYRVA